MVDADRGGDGAEGLPRGPIVRVVSRERAEGSPRHDAAPPFDGGHQVGPEGLHPVPRHKGRVLIDEQVDRLRKVRVVEPRAPHGRVQLEGAAVHDLSAQYAALEARIRALA